MILRRRKPPKMGVRTARKLDFPGHRQWVAGFVCSVPGCPHKAEAAHFDGPIPNEDRGGLGKKDHDRWCFPLCRNHHTGDDQSYHRIGWAAFDKLHGINTRRIAENCARTSPHRTKWMTEP